MRKKPHPNPQTLHLSPDFNSTFLNPNPRNAMIKAKFSVPNRYYLLLLMHKTPKSYFHPYSYICNICCVLLISTTVLLPATVSPIPQGSRDRSQLSAAIDSKAFSIKTPQTNQTQPHRCLPLFQQRHQKDTAVF